MYIEQKEVKVVKTSQKHLIMFICSIFITSTATCVVCLCAYVYIYICVYIYTHICLLIYSLTFNESMSYTIRLGPHSLAITKIIFF